jgi:hypothetical protein
MPRYYLGQISIEGFRGINNDGARRSARAPLIAPKNLVDDTRRGYAGMG